MVLVDTNVWIEHFKSSSKELVELLLAGQVVIHELILGELSLAHFNKKDREIILERLEALERVKSSTHKDVYEFSQKQKLFGKGIGWIDSHLLHASITQDLTLWTFDKNLSKLADQFKKS